MGRELKLKLLSHMAHLVGELLELLILLVGEVPTGVPRS